MFQRTSTIAVAALVAITALSGGAMAAQSSSVTDSSATQALDTDLGVADHTSGGGSAAPRPPGIDLPTIPTGYATPEIGIHGPSIDPGFPYPGEGPCDQPPFVPTC
ncbi:hypothetical protein [Halobacterium jilantaiense]|uniref:hypothetical protein n=1 Tax=Halobacterium jilantaiense TaxID=355548 RepID=UPI00115FB1D6|nr:hypothetical protein [Halobacterium jilantaiense]